MTGQVWLGIGLVLLGAVAGAPPLVLVGVLVTLIALLRGLWTRYGLRSVDYERRLATDRAVFGDEFALDVVVWNRKLLPLPWLRADDFVPEELVVARAIPRPIGPTGAFAARQHVVAGVVRARGAPPARGRQPPRRLPDERRPAAGGGSLRARHRRGGAVAPGRVRRAAANPSRARTSGRSLDAGRTPRTHEPVPRSRAVRGRAAVPARGSAATGALEGHGAHGTDGRQAVRPVAAA